MITCLQHVHTFQFTQIYTQNVLIVLCFFCVSSCCKKRGYQKQNTSHWEDGQSLHSPAVNHERYLCFVYHKHWYLLISQNQMLSLGFAGVSLAYRIILCHLRLTRKSGHVGERVYHTMSQSNVSWRKLPFICMQSVVQSNMLVLRFWCAGKGLFCLFGLHSQASHNGTLNSIILCHLRLTRKKVHVGEKVYHNMIQSTVSWRKLPCICMQSVVESSVLGKARFICLGCSQEPDAMGPSTC